MNARVAVVLPARYHSTRFPGKPLAMVAGKPLIEWGYRRASEIQCADRVIVATDHQQIADAVRSFGGEVVFTADNHTTGTDRVAEVAASLDHDVIVNLQGDEPIFSKELVEEMVAVIRGNDSIDIVTPCHPIHDIEAGQNPNIVKVVMSNSGDALYFSRSAIPHGAWSKEGIRDAAVNRHIGIYVFRKRSLIEFAKTPRSPLEISEGLEQLRALENGMRIRVVTTSDVTVGVDVPEDIKSVEKALSSA